MASTAREAVSPPDKGLLLEVKALEKRFAISRENILGGAKQWVRAVDGVSFTVNRGSVFGLVGESGSGKTTVAKMVSGIIGPSAGSIWLDGTEVTIHNRTDSMWFKNRVQMVFQNPTSSLNPRRTIHQTLEVPLTVKKVPKRTRRERIDELLELVELPTDYSLRYPSALSGGQRQRVAIARALAQEPDLVVLDEPTSALDVSVQAKVIGVLLKLREQLNLTYLFISHDLGLMRNIADQTAVMYLGEIVEYAPTTMLFTAPKHPYTQMLLSAIPVVSKEEESVRPARLKPEGEIPSPAAIPRGCRFHTRCPFVMEKCHHVSPKLQQVAPDHWVSCHLY